MSTDLSKPVVTVAIVLLLFVSVLGTWIALTGSPGQVYHSGPQAGQVQITVEPYVTGPQPQGGEVTIIVVKGGQV